jgi:hypothetical protein
VINEQLLARAVAINEALAGEFVDQQPMPTSAALSRLARLGICQQALLRTSTERAQRILFRLRHEREPQDERQLERWLERLTDAERAQLAALAIAWCEGALAALRARRLERRA